MGKLEVLYSSPVREFVKGAMGFNTVVRYLYIPLYALELTVISPQ